MSNQPTAAETRSIEVTIVRRTPLQVFLRLPWMWWKFRRVVRPRDGGSRSILAARVTWSVFTTFVRSL